MAIKVIRICDKCKKKYKQIIDKLEINTVKYDIDFICSDCILKEQKEQKEDEQKEDEQNAEQCLIISQILKVKYIGTLNNIQEVINKRRIKLIEC